MIEVNISDRSTTKLLELISIETATKRNTVKEDLIPDGIGLINKRKNLSTGYKRYVTIIINVI